MKYKVFFFALAVVFTASLVLAEDGDRMLYKFDTPNAAKRWTTVNDGVMGGRSDGRFRINEDKKMEFYGTLSLENNGGFASVRSRGTKLGLGEGDSIVARVRGDGREYQMNLYTPSRRTALSYRASFRTKKDEWIEVSIPVKDVVATSFGRVVPNQSLDPGEVNGLGILLGDKKPGAFRLEVDWIKASSFSNAIANNRKHIEGTWRIVSLVVNGIQTKEEDARKLTVMNGSDGTWSLRSEEKEISKGTSTFDPMQKPKHINFTPTVGDAKDKLHLGIYELGENTRRLCFAPHGQERPNDFFSAPDSRRILVTFERVKTE